MAFPQQFLDELSARTDIVDLVSSYVALTKKGTSNFGLCPFTTSARPPSPSRRISRCTTASAVSTAAGR